MAYGLRILNNHTSVLGDRWEVRILERDYSGVVFERKLGSQLMFSFDNIGDSYEAVLKSTTVEIPLIAERDYEYFDLFTGDTRQFKVEIDRNEEAYFRGWITPSEYIEDFEAGIYVATIWARDGIGELSSRKYLQGRNQRYEGFTSLYEVLSNCLNSIGLDLDFRIGVYYRPSGRERNLRGTFVNASTFYPSNITNQTVDDAPFMSNLLQTLLSEPFNIRIFQHGGYWYVIDWRQYGFDQVNYSTYDHDTNAQIGYTNIDLTHEILRDRTCLDTQIVANSNNIRFNPAYSFQAIQFDYGVRDKINGSDWIISNNTPADTFGSFQANPESRFTNGLIIDSNNGITGIGTAGIGGGSGTLFQQSSIRQSFGDNLDRRTDLILRWNISLEDNDLTTVFNHYFRIRQYISAVEYYVYTQGGNWVLNNPNVFIEMPSVSLDGNDYSFQIRQRPIDAPIEILWWGTNRPEESEERTVTISKMDVFASVGREEKQYLISNNIEIYLSEDNNLINETIETVYGDLPYVGPETNVVYEGGYRKDNEGTPTDLWQYRNDQLGRIWEDVFASWLIEFRDFRRVKKQLKLRTNQYSILNSLAIEFALPIRMLLNGGTYTSGDCIFEGEWIEIGGYELPTDNRLLIDNTYYLLRDPFQYVNIDKVPDLPEVTSLNDNDLLVLQKEGDDFVKSIKFSNFKQKDDIRRGRVATSNIIETVTYDPYPNNEVVILLRVWSDFGNVSYSIENIQNGSFDVNLGNGNELTYIEYKVQWTEKVASFSDGFSDGFEI